MIIRHKSIDHYYSQLWIIICCCCSVDKLCLTLCDPLDYSLIGSSVHGILQAGILEWVAISFFRRSSQISDGTCVSCIGRWILYHWATREAKNSGKSHGRRNLVGCSPWGCEELDTTERLHFHFSLSCIGEGNGNPLQCSCLENPRDGGVWWAAVYGVAQSWTRLKWLSSSIGKMYLRYFTLQGLLCWFVNWISVFNFFIDLWNFRLKGEKSVTLCLWDCILPWQAKGSVSLSLKVLSIFQCWNNLRIYSSFIILTDF